MPTSLRTLGVHGKNAPAKKSKVVQASDFNIGAVIGHFERKYDKAFEVANILKKVEIFGENVNSAYYGSDEVDAFFNNLQGQNGKLWIKSHVGFTGSAIDAVVASVTVTDLNGLASAVTLAKDIQTVFNAHAADGAIHSTAADAVNFPVSTVVNSLSSLVTFTNLMITAYSAHEADAALGLGWAFHAAAETGPHVLASTTPVTDLTTAIAMLNNMKLRLNDHDADAVAHVAGSTHQITAGAASETPATTLIGQSAYQENLDYGTSGNRTGHKFVNGIRFATALNGTVAAGATSAVLDSVIGVKVGDLVHFNATGGTPALIVKKITLVNESTKTVSWSGAFSAGATTGQDNDVVSVPGFQIKTYRKSISGIESEVETELGRVYCTMEPEVSEYYVENVHKDNKWMKWTDQSSASTTAESFPDNSASVVYLTGGADGTSPTTVSHWSRDLTKLDGLPVRMACNPETIDVDIQKAGEAYCKARDDSPIWLPTLQSDRTFDQLKVIGAAYQRSDDIPQVNVADWLGIDDVFNTAAGAPDRIVPNVGFVMGAWIRTIAVLGVHYIPAVDAITIVGANSIKNDNLGDLTDTQRTELAEYGINIIQFVSGSGIRIRNFFTPSTDTVYMFANGLLMRNYFKVSSEDSLRSSENYPNTFRNIKQDADAIRTFMLRHWYKGSTGNAPEGETFGQQENTDGSLTTFADHVQVTADPINNPQANINAGERTIDLYFTYPTPAGSIEIKTGILLR